MRMIIPELRQEAATIDEQKDLTSPVVGLIPEDGM